MSLFKNQVNTNEAIREQMSNKKAIRHKENNDQNDNRKSLSNSSLTTLNISGLKSSKKRCRLDEWIQNQELAKCYIQGLILGLRTHRLKVKGWEETFHANGSQERKSDYTNIKQNRLLLKNWYKDIIYW